MVDGKVDLSTKDVIRPRFKNVPERTCFPRAKNLAFHFHQRANFIVHHAEDYRFDQTKEGGRCPIHILGVLPSANR